ncbi:MAG: hypothetical protein WCP20_08175 [Desulfuromonadales bacterium]
MGLTPTEQEYMALHPDRLKDGRIYCECGACNIRSITAPTDNGSIIYVCTVCNTMLFTDGMNGKCQE